MQPRPNIIDAGDVLIVGAGLAGLFTALKLGHRPVTILAAGGPRKASASSWAQGGIAVAIGPDDSPAQHKNDTINAGAGLVDPEIAGLLAEEAEARIEDLVGYGVPFNRNPDGSFQLSREAAHSRNRIAGVSGDRAGREIMSALADAVAANPSIRKLTGFSACELAIEDGRVVGVFARPGETASSGNHTPLLIKARAVILACGGSGYLFATTTNPVFANGEAVAMAARAGAQIVDTEFMQFHPTAFTGLGDPAPLATEALRGEGAKLLNRHGEAFMTGYHADAELAPRDIVSRAVFNEIMKTGKVGLDLRGSLADKLHSRFPTVYEYCKRGGIDPTREVLPVAPAAHYHMGGIRVDVNGRTSLPSLWACGECAATGAHGANRLASNSLLEAIVFGARIAEHLDDTLPIRAVSSPEPAQTDLFSDNTTVMPAIRELRQVMTRHVGVIRERAGLLEALQVITRLERAANGATPLANMTVTALLITAAALMREESRGGHFRSDFPTTGKIAERKILTLDVVRQLADDALKDPQVSPQKFINESI